MPQFRNGRALICVDKESYEFIVELADECGLSRIKALSILIKELKRQEVKIERVPATVKITFKDEL